jgi:hypothetical protein
MKSRSARALVRCFEKVLAEDPHSYDALVTLADHSIFTG